MSATYFTSTFKATTTNFEYVVNIKSKTLNAGTSEDIKLTKSGFKLKYDKGKDTKIAEIKSSSVSIGLIIENDAAKNQVNTILGTSEGDWYIEIKRQGAVYWTGWVKPAYDSFNDGAFPYVLNMRATDSLGRLMNKLNNTITTSGPADYKDLYHGLKIFFDSFDIDSLPIDNFSVLSLFTFWAEELPYNTSVNAMRKLVYNRNTFVEDNANNPGLIQSYLQELKGVLKSFNIKLIYSNNRYCLIQDTGLGGAAPYVWLSNTPDATATEFRLNTDIRVQPLSVDNSLDVTSVNGKMLSGGQFRLDPEINSVSGRYIKGNALCTFNPGQNYNNITTIGVVDQGTTQLYLNLNLDIVDVWDSSAVTPHAYQQHYMTGLLYCKLKVGNLYLSSNGIFNNNTTMGWEWSTDPASTFQFASGFGTSDVNALENFMMQTTGYIYNYDADSPVGFDTATIKLIIMNLALPALESFGEVQFEMNGGIVYFQLPSSTVVYSPDDYFANLYANIMTLQMPISSGLNTTNIPVSRDLNILTVPLISSIIEGLIGDSDNTAGTQYYASVSPSTSNIDKDLGDFVLGNISSAESTLNTIRLLQGGQFANAGGFDIGSGTQYRNLTQLVINEYLKISDKPTVILQGNLLAAGYEVTRPLLYEDEIGGTKGVFIFVSGTFNAASDTWSGTWYKQDKSTETIVEDTTPIYDPGSITDTFGDAVSLVPTKHTLGGGYGGHGGPGVAHTPIKLKGNVQKNLNASNSIGTLTTKVLKNTTTTSLQVAYLRTALQTGQDIFLLNEASENGLRITTTNKAPKGATTIDVNFTTPIGYDVNSKVLIAAYDIPNHPAGVSKIIAGSNVTISPTTGVGDVTINSSGGGGGGNPGGINQSVQYKNGTNFDGESAFVYNESTNNLTVPITNSWFFGNNTGHRTFINRGYLEYYISALDFDLGSNNKFFIFSSGGGGTSEQTGFNTKSPHRFTAHFLPVGYRIIKVDVAASANLNFEVLKSVWSTPNVATIQGGGTTNTTMNLTTPFVINPGEYTIIFVESKAANDKIFGARFTLQKV